MGFSLRCLAQVSLLFLSGGFGTLLQISSLFLPIGWRIVQILHQWQRKMRLPCCVQVLLPGGSLLNCPMNSSSLQRFSSTTCLTTSSGGISSSPSSPAQPTPLINQYTYQTRENNKIQKCLFILESFKGESYVYGVVAKNNAYFALLNGLLGTTSILLCSMRGISSHPLTCPATPLINQYPNQTRENNKIRKCLFTLKSSKREINDR